MNAMVVIGVIVGGLIILLLANFILDRILNKRDLNDSWVPDNDPYLIARRIGKAMEEEKKSKEGSTSTTNA